MLETFQNVFARIREQLPASLNQQIYPYYVWAKLPLADWCLDPSFLVIGAQKSGTTSLYKYLTRSHPAIIPALKKDIRYYNRHYDEGLNWYRTNFPLSPSLYGGKPEHFRTGEGTPTYLLSSEVPSRIHADFPDIRLIALLRNPVERAISHYNYQSDRNNISEDLSTVIDREREYLDNRQDLDFRRWPRIEPNVTTVLSPGVYVNQLKRYLEHFSRDQLLVFQSESFFKNPAKTLRKIFAFLDLPDTSLPDNLPAWEQSRNRAEVPKSVRQDMIDFFEPYTHELFELLEKSFTWEEFT